jgi:CheY-like chemotaxis protein
LDGFEAGQKAVHLQPAVVILDVYLPGVDGISICRRIRGDESLKHTRILTISGQSTPEMEKDVKRAGGDGFLTKPFTPDQLCEVLETIWPELKRQAITRDKR